LGNNLITLDMIKAYEYFLDADVSVSVKSKIQELDLHFKKIEENLLEIILASQKGKLGINKQFIDALKYIKIVCKKT
tara:strand:+ start:1170 stop:1400 length:231 start_codon:yes stop_codon:yes gene_type:complete